MRLLVVLLLVTGCYRPSTLVVDVVPPPREEVVIYKPGYIWIQGNWVREGGQWRWRGGRYERERPSYVYSQGYWQRRGNTYVWHPGGWKPRGRVIVQQR